MLKYLRELCLIDGPSGSESKVTDYIRSVIEPYCECSTDACGNLIAFKKGKSRAARKVLLDAHVDEVGFIVTDIDENGFLGFRTLGGINIESLLGKRVTINGCVGVIQIKPIHLLKADEKRKLPDKDSLTIDIGADSLEEALRHVSLGDSGTFASRFVEFGDGFIKAKAIDDRLGCAVLMQLATEEAEHDFWLSFSTQEEVGLRGSKVSSFTVAPDMAIVVESTSAADLVNMPAPKTVCEVGKGAVVSFMDRCTIYPQQLVRAAMAAAEENGIPAQFKRAVAGGNDAGEIHLAHGGVATVGLAVPCRYLHSPSCVIAKRDADAVLALTRVMLGRMTSGELIL